MDLADLSSFRRDDRFKKETVFYIVVGDREMELRAPNSKEVEGWVSHLSSLLPHPFAHQGFPAFCSLSGGGTGVIPQGVGCMGAPDCQRGPS